MRQEILERLANIEKVLKGQTEKPLTLNEAAEYLTISKSSIYKLTCSNKIPHWKPTGKKIYFSKSELDAWIFRNPVKTIDAIEQEADDYLVSGKKHRMKHHER